MKGIIFNLAAIIMVLFLILALHFLPRVRGRYQSIRAEEILFFLADMEEDLERALEIAGLRATVAAVSEVVSTGEVFEQANESLAELMLNATLDGEVVDFLVNHSIKRWEEKIADLSRRKGLRIAFLRRFPKIYPNNSFSLLFEVKLEINLSDELVGINIHRNISANKMISLIGIEDPLYSLNVLGRGMRVIKRCTHVPYTTHGFQGSSQNLTNCIDSKYYHFSERGASFLDRLEGNLFLSAKYQALSNFTIGLETFVDLAEIATYGIAIKENQSCVDYLYFDSQPHPGFQVSDTYDWFMIDEANAQKYGLENLLI
jgi:hypothetical protein